MRLIYIPLDERPCNSKFPLMIAEKHPDVEMIDFPLSLYGTKKTAPKVDDIWEKLLSTVKDGDTLALSLDMLIYGGLIPSRLHYLDEETVAKRLNNFTEMKKRYPNIRILASNCIMRCPTYNSSEEEPDYYADFGTALHRSAYLKNKQERVGIDAMEMEELASYSIPSSVVDDYESRRRFNENVNISVLKLVQNKVIDALVIPQDDAAPFGYTALSQQRVIQAIKAMNLEDQVSIYPGADEVGCTLCARALNADQKQTPKIYVFYAATLGPSLIPLYEDRPMHETLKHHVLALGAQLVSSPQEADFIVAVNCPGLRMQRAKEQHKNQDMTYNTHRNLREFVVNIKRYIKQGYPVVVSDSAYGNGGDMELLRLLDREDLLDKIIAYSAWNTNANTLGTALCMGNFVWDSKKTNFDHVLYRIVEDSLYQANIRQDLLNDYLPSISCEDYHFDEKQEDVENQCADSLLAFYKTLDLSKRYPITKLKVSFPWNRLFEVDLDLEWEHGS